MRRVRGAGAVVVMAVVLTGCPVTPPGYSPPKVESVDVSPQPVTPGAVLTVHLDVRDDVGVTNGGVMSLTTPSSTVLRGTNSCVVGRELLDGPTLVRLTVECPVPAFASNGTWHVEVRINDSAPPLTTPGSTIQVPFEVTGGSDDRRAPQLLSYGTDPAVVRQDTTFTLTMRFRDESLPVAIAPAGNVAAFWFGKAFSPNSSFACHRATYTPVSATEVDVSIDCRPTYYNVDAPVEVGTYRASPTVSDALGHEGHVEMFVEVHPMVGALGAAVGR